MTRKETDKIIAKGQTNTSPKQTSRCGTDKKKKKKKKKEKNEQTNETEEEEKKTTDRQGRRKRRTNSEGDEQKNGTVHCQMTGCVFNTKPASRCDVMNS